VSHLGAPPLIFIGVSKGALSRQMRGTHAEPHLGGAEEPPCGRGKSDWPSIDFSFLWEVDRWALWSLIGDLALS
jgi:hypothetical protein